MKKLISLLLTLLLCIGLAASNTALAGTVQQLNKTNMTLKVGNSSTLKLTGASGSIQWTSSKKSIATVSSKGRVTAVSAGKATITAANAGKSYQCTVTITDPKVKLILAAYSFDEKINLNEYMKNLKVENPEFIDIKKYDNTHCIVTLKESDRLKLIKEANKQMASFSAEIDSLTITKGAFTQFEADKLLKKVKVYADGDKFNPAYDLFGITLALDIITDYVQALNFVDIKDRGYQITVVDKNNGTVLYPDKQSK